MCCQAGSKMMNWEPAIFATLSMPFYPQSMLKEVVECIKSLLAENRQSSKF